MIFALICLTGCRYTFELGDSDMKPMIAVRSCMCADSLTMIQVHKTVPVTEISKADTSLVNPGYSLRCNGKEVDASHSMIGEGGMSINGPAFRSGDKVEITFSAEGMETVTASTVIPDEFPEYSLNFRESNEGYNTLTINYKDNPNKTNYYGVRIWWKGRRIIHNGNGEIEQEFPMKTSVKPYGNYDSIQIDPGAYSPVLVGTSDGDIYFWSDEDEEDDEYEVLFTYTYGWDVEAGTIEVDGLRCQFFSLSEEMYRVMYADYDSSYNPFAYIGFSSPSFTYSNIRNGLGYFCGYRTADTGWFTIDKEEK